MARSSQLFVGPYAEWADVGGGFTSDDPRWADLLDGGSLEWNIGISGWAYVRRGERQVEVACCMPAQPRHGCRRWPMSVTLAHGDWSAGADFVADWTGRVRTRAGNWTGSRRPSRASWPWPANSRGCSRS